MFQQDNTQGQVMSLTVALGHECLSAP